MSFRLLEIESFKCFSSLKLPLAPLSLLTGFNAAGKSTALQALLLLTQAARYAPRASLIGLNGPLVNLGSVGEVVARGSEGNISIAVSSEDKKVVWKFHPLRGLRGEFVQLGETLIGSRGNDLSFPGSAGFWPVDEPQDKLFGAVRSTIYLSSARNVGAELYPSPQREAFVPLDVGPSGEFAPWWYVQIADDEISPERRHPTEERITIRGQIDAWLNELFPGVSANVEAVAKTSLSRLEFRIGKSSDWHRPTNTGFGLSYVFPLLVALTTMSPGQVIIVESPEAHLHPRAQSRMGEILARFAGSGLQILIESHSDHILSGIRMGVRKRLLKSQDCAIHFFQGENSINGHVGIVSPSVDENGQLDSWPDGFFDQFEKDLNVLTGWNNDR